MCRLPCKTSNWLDESTTQVVTRIKFCYYIAVLLLVIEDYMCKLITFIAMTMCEFCGFVFVFAPSNLPPFTSWEHDNYLCSRDECASWSYGVRLALSFTFVNDNVRIIFLFECLNTVSVRKNVSISCLRRRRRRRRKKKKRRKYRNEKYLNEKFKFKLVLIRL